jgi:cytochrome P450
MITATASLESKQMAEILLGIITHPAFGFLFTLCFLAAVAISISNYWRLRQFKGPLLGATSKLWMMQATFHGDMHLAVADVCQKYGSLARIGPNDLVTCDPEIIRKMGAVRSPYRRSDWYKATAFDHHLSHVFCEVDEARHIDLRNKLIPGYSGRENEHLEESIDSCLEELFRLIREKYTSSGAGLRAVDFARLASFLTVDVIHTLAFGAPMGFLEKDEDINHHFANEKVMLPVFEWLSTLPILERTIRIPWISKRVMPTTEDKTGTGLLMRQVLPY